MYYTSSIKNTFSRFRLFVFGSLLAIVAAAYLFIYHTSPTPLPISSAAAKSFDPTLHSINIYKDTLMTAFEKAYGSNAIITSDANNISIIITSLGTKAHDVYNNNELLPRIHSSDFSILYNTHKDEVSLKFALHQKGSTSYASVPTDVLFAIAKTIDGNKQKL